MNDLMLSSLKTYWERLRAGRIAPYRAEIDPRQFEPALENMFIVEKLAPDNLRIRELMARLAGGEVKELILATDPNTEGEATATYLALMVKPMGITVTRLASGLPVGGDLEYADEVTLGRAFEGRRRV